MLSKGFEHGRTDSDIDILAGGFAWSRNYAGHKSLFQTKVQESVIRVWDI